MTKEDKLFRQSSGGHSTSSANTNSPTEESRKMTDDLNVPKKDYSVEKIDKDQIESSKLDQILNSEKQEEHVLCACWCQGWAEIYVRRPTGDMSWVMRIQNSMQFETYADFPVHDIVALYKPSEDLMQKQKESPSECSGDEVKVRLQNGSFIVDSNCKLRLYVLFFCCQQKKNL